MTSHTEDCGPFSNGCNGECTDPMSVHCDECDEDSDLDACEEVKATATLYVVKCPNCDEEIVLGGGDGGSYREDFHADG